MVDQVDNTEEQGQNRTTREAKTRDAEKRTAQWVRPEVLPNPEPVDGYVYRYVRVHMAGQNDAMNVSSKLREGWEPVKAKDHPEIQMSVVENERFKDNIMIGGLLLCRAPVEVVEQREEFYRQRAKNQMQAVDNNLMRENDPRMPLFNDSKSRVTFGKG